MSQSSNKEFAMAVGTSSMLEPNMMEGENFYTPMETSTQPEPEPEPEQATQNNWSNVKNDTGQLCRACANTSDYLIPIFEGEGLEHQLETKITKHLPIQVTATDTLPLQLCYQCASTLIAWDTMINSCIEADKKLRAMQEAAGEEIKDTDDFDSSHIDNDTIDSDDEPLITSKAKLAEKKKVPIKKKILSKAKSKNLTVKNDKTASDSKEGEEKERYEEEEDEKNASKSENASRRTRENRKTVLRMKNNAPLSKTKESESCDEEDAKPDFKYGECGYKCDVCSRVFAKKYNLTAHKKALHSSCPKKYVCDVCGKEFSFKSNYNTHRYVHMDLPRSFKCVQCCSGFKNARGLKNHVKTHNADKNYVCEVCGKKFTTSMNLKNHMYAHSEVRPHVCEMCEASFKRQSHLQQHQKEVHGVHKTKSARNFTCDECANSFTTNERLEIHKRKHTGELPFKCDKCYRGFASQMALNVHHTMGECHNKTNSCKICQLEFKPGEEPCVHVLEKRANKNHAEKRARAKKEKVLRKDKPRNYRCELCDKTFIFNCDKNQHYRTCHTDERPFVCDECGKAFKAKNTLQNHQAVHSDSRPYPCSFCEKRFRRTEQLVLHTRTHTGEKPHLCNYCGRGFAQMGDMKKHRKIHNRNS